MSAAAQTWESPYTVNARWAIRLLPSLIDFAFILPAFLLFAFLSGTTQLLKDGDTGWHIRTGQWILQHGEIPKTDLFSFTKSHDAWVAWEWGWDVCFAAVHHIWGLAGVTFVNVCLLCGISGLLFLLIRRCCGNDPLSLAFTLIAVCGSILHWLARPHLVSWLLLLIFLHVLMSAEKRNVKLLWCLPFLAVLWANLHGSFLLSIVMVSTAAVGAACAALARRESWSSACGEAKPYLLCTFLCAAATLLNPYGWRLHRHVFSYLHNAKLLDHIAEYRSFNFHQGAIFFECMLLLGVGAAWWCLGQCRFTPALLTLLFAHAALLYERNIPLFLFTASPWAACMVHAALCRINWRGNGSRLCRTIAEVCEELQVFERVPRWHLASVLTIVCLAVLFLTGASGFAAQFDPKQFPIQDIPSLTRISRSRIFTYDQWGDYMIYRFFPGTRVFTDGRSDFYGSEFVDTYAKIINAEYNWEADLRRYRVDTVILRPDAPLATVLKQSTNWKLLFDNGSAIVFTAAPQSVGRMAETGRVQVSPVFHDGGNECEPSGIREDSNSEFIDQKRRSL